MIQHIANQQVNAVASIHGIGFRILNDSSTWRIDFKDEATQAERAAAQAVVDAFDVAVEEQKLEAAKVRKEQARAVARANPLFRDLVKAGLL